MTTPAPWSSASADAVRAAGAALSAAVLAHADAVASTSGEDDAPAVFAAGDLLLPHALAYADAQFDHTGAGWPLGVLYQLVEDKE